MKKIAIVGASYLQVPLILKAKEMGFETHVFAWQCGDEGERLADYFYPISIVEKDDILEKCKEIRIDGICTIASDLAAVTVNYVANRMGLPGNSDEASLCASNKHIMRKTFQKNGDPSPKSMLVESVEDLNGFDIKYPIIVKPTDRSGSRGITKLMTSDGLAEAIELAKEQGFEKKVLVEEYVSGKEYSVECISYNGEHHFLAMTYKFTTGAPHFIETAHLEPAPLSEELLNKVKKVVFHALNSLQITNSASHSEVKIDDEGEIVIIEIGGRMGGDCIGSSLVDISTGVDFVKNVIEVAVGREPDLQPKHKSAVAAVRFVFSKEDIDILNEIKSKNPSILIEEDVHEISNVTVSDSSLRFGYYIFKADKLENIKNYLPNMGD